jgi:tRNA (guanine10-N2)-methyltransferase
MSQQAAVRQRFAPSLPFRGPVVLSDDADVTLVVVLDFALRQEELVSEPSEPSAGSVADTLVVSRPHASRAEPPMDQLRRVFVGVPYPTRRALHVELALTRRAFLGPTSLEPLLALSMCNMAGIRSGSVVLDPFVGTGSVLVAAARIGGVTFGVDVDYRVLCMGKMGRTVATNFEQYGLPLPELVRGDMAELCLRRSALANLFDAVVCDPPYGVRAGARQSDEGAKRDPGAQETSAATAMRRASSSASKADACSLSGETAVAVQPTHVRSIPRTRQLEGEQVCESLFSCSLWSKVWFERPLVGYSALAGHAEPS